MADISIIEKIAKGEVISPITDYAQVADTNKIFKRTGSSPADVTEIFMNKLSAEAYAKGELDEKYQDGLVSYVGQHITVIDKNTGTADMYQIQNTAGDLKKLLAEPLKGQEFDFDQYTLSEVLKQVIEALGGTVKQTQV